MNGMTTTPRSAHAFPSLTRLAGVVEEFRKLDPEMPAQTILAFLLIAAEPGLHMRDLEKRLGVAPSSTSRNVAVLSEHHKAGRPGHNLVRAEEDHLDRRHKVLYLTPKGRRLLDSITHLLKGRE